MIDTLFSFLILSMVFFCISVLVTQFTFLFSPKLAICDDHSTNYKETNDSDKQK